MNLPGYDASDERSWSYNVANNDGFWRIRGLGNEVLQEFINGNAGWRFSRDNIYRGSTLLALRLYERLVSTASTPMVCIS